MTKCRNGILLMILLLAMMFLPAGFAFAEEASVESAEETTVEASEEASGEYEDSEAESQTESQEEPQEAPQAEPQEKPMAQPQAKPQAEPKAETQAKPMAKPNAETQAEPMAETNGFGWDNYGLWYTDENGVDYYNRWKTANGKTYYFGSDGYAVTGFYTGSNGDLYYFDPEDCFQYKNCWKEIDGDTYYFNRFGVAARGVYRFTPTSPIHYFDPETGAQYKNAWCEIGGKTYYFNKYGIPTKGFARIPSNGPLHFFDNNGVAYKNRWLSYDGDTYYFNAYGCAVRGLVRIPSNGPLHFFNNDGTQVKNAWKSVNGKTYYFNAYGCAMTGMRTIGGVDYYFDARTGVQYKNRWVKHDGKSYFFNPYGVKVRGFYKPVGDSETYYFNPETGAQMKGQAISSGGKVYFLNKFGVALRSCVTKSSEDGGAYILDANGAGTLWTMSVDEPMYSKYVVRGTNYVLTPRLFESGSYLSKDSDGNLTLYNMGSGKAITSQGYHQIGISKFYVDADGHVVTGFCIPEPGVLVIADAFGAMDTEAMLGASRGPDISLWNGYHNGFRYTTSNLRYDVMAEAGYDFVILRAGTGYKGGYKDETFEESYAAAKRAGLNVGTYFYSYATTKKQAEKEIDLYLKILAGKKFEYPIYVDLEEEGAGQQGSLSKKELTDLAVYMCDRLRSEGYCAGIYANANWLTNKFQNDRIRNYEIWVAQWNDRLYFDEMHVGMWQFTDSARIPGHSGKFDMNFSLMDYPTLIRQEGLNGY